MAFLFRSARGASPKPSELVTSLVEAWARARAGGGPGGAAGGAANGKNKAPEEVVLSEKLAAVRKAMAPQEGDEGIRAIAKEATATGVDMLPALIAMLPRVPFEAKKDAVAIFQGLMRTANADGTVSALDDILKREGMLAALAEKYDAPEEALHAGSMLKECVRYAPLAKIALTDEDVIARLFKHADDVQFDVASYAFACLADLLTRHPQVIAEVLAEKAAVFTKRLNALVASENYVTRRQSLRLLARLLQTPANLRPFTAPYVSDVGNLALCMEALRDSSKAIQGEAFHVVKIFVANPVKPADVCAVLSANQPKLLRLLTTMPPPPPPPPSTGAGVTSRADAVDEGDAAADLAEVIGELERLTPDASPA